MRRLPTWLTVVGFLAGIGALALAWTEGSGIHDRYRGAEALEQEVRVVKLGITLVSISALSLLLAATLGLKELVAAWRARKPGLFTAAHVVGAVMPGILLMLTHYAYQWLPVVHKSHIFDLGL